MDIILPFTDCIFSILLSFALKLFNIRIDITYLFDMVLSGYLKLRIIPKLTTNYSSRYSTTERATEFFLLSNVIVQYDRFKFKWVPNNVLGFIDTLRHH